MPRPRFPLWLHPTGQWCKKLRGTNFYFGTDREAALRRYAAEWDDIKAGRPRPGRPGAGPPPAADLTLAELVNLFLTARRAQVDSGELSAGAWANYHRAAARLVGVLGRARLFSSLQPADFGRLRAAAAAGLGPESLSLFIALARGILGYGAGLLDRPVRYGGQFDRPARRVLRLHRQQRGKRLVPAEDLRRLVAAADPPLRAQVLLGLNCGFGASDCSDLRRADLAARPGWLALARKKSGVPRLCPLWPETARAIEAAIAARPAPADPAFADRVFLSPRGFPCVRHTPAGDGTKGGSIDAVGRAWKVLCGRLGVAAPGSFYVLRHVFRTVADETRDRPAIDLIMGHADESMAAFYREELADERLRAVADHVRAWLWPPAARPRGKKSGKVKS